MLDFRLLIGAFALGVAFIGAVLFWVEEGDVSINSLGPRPGLATAAAPRVAAPPAAARPDRFVIPEPIAVPQRAAKEFVAAPEITGSLPAGAAPPAEAAPPPPPRPRTVAKKKESSEEIPLFNPFRLFFPRGEGQSK